MKIKIKYIEFSYADIEYICILLSACGITGMITALFNANYTIQQLQFVIGMFSAIIFGVIAYFCSFFEDSGE